MSNPYFRFKQFTIHQDRCAMKVTTDGCLFGAWAAEELSPSTPNSMTEKSRVKILDIGTGTGLLSLMIVQKINANITAVEIDKDAFMQASENINASLWKENIEIFHADIKGLDLREQYDVIISNPPFYESEWLSGDSKRNMAHHSSELPIGDLLTVIKQNLRPTGQFYLLLPYKRHKQIMKLFDEQKVFIAKKILVRQTEEHDYFRFMIKAQFTETNQTITEEIAIRNKENDYTTEFTTLLKDYYLYL
jgi:tRNA1Val (adenine37-N6)-methyltransferase